MYHSTYSEARQARSVQRQHSNNIIMATANDNHSKNRSNSGQSQTLNFHRIRNKIAGNNRKHRSSSSGGSIPGSAFTAPKSAPLPRKMYSGSNSGSNNLNGSSNNLNGSTSNLSHHNNRLLSMSRSRENLFASSQDMRFLPPEVKNSNCSVYNRGGGEVVVNNGDYSELRAIVRRIEQSNNKIVSEKNNNYSRTDEFSSRGGGGGGKSPQVNRKRMYFDYVVPNTPTVVRSKR